MATRTDLARSTPSAVQTFPQQTCLLFTLPAELRNYIYGLVLTVEPNAYGTVVLVHSRQGEQEIPRSVLSVLEVCRQILTEAETIFFDVNKISLRYYYRSQFDWSRPTPTPAFPKFGPSRAAAIRTLEILVWNGETLVLLLKQLRRFPRLERLSIRLADGFAHRSLAREEKRIISHVTKLKVLEDVRLIGGRMFSQKDLDNLFRFTAELDGKFKKSRLKSVS